MDIVAVMQGDFGKAFMELLFGFGVIGFGFVLLNLDRFYAMHRNGLARIRASNDRDRAAAMRSHPAGKARAAATSDNYLA